MRDAGLNLLDHLLFLSIFFVRGRAAGWLSAEYRRHFTKVKDIIIYLYLILPENIKVD